MIAIPLIHGWFRRCERQLDLPPFIFLCGRNPLARLHWWLLRSLRLLWALLWRPSHPSSHAKPGHKPHRRDILARSNHAPSALRNESLQAGRNADSNSLATRLRQGISRRLLIIRSVISRYVRKGIQPLSSTLLHTLQPGKIWTSQANRLSQGHLRWLIMGLILVCGSLAMLANLSTFGQTGITLCFLLVVLMIRRWPPRQAHLALMFITTLLLARYVIWRTTQTMDLETPMELALGYALLAAEAYTWMVLLFGFVQTAWPLQRDIKPLAVTSTEWPSVDIFIPTYNEPLHIVEHTVYAALGIDWPKNKLTIYLLDDGQREDFRAFAAQVGIEYRSRTDRSGAKAGNINAGMADSHGDYIAVFDCDHIPTRSFLQTAMAPMLTDPQCAMVQTPHHFYSQDPFERNLAQGKPMPNESDLFYGLVQEGNDLWNAAFFCGSCAILKRSALESIGGMPTETVTEDAHTALRLHRAGYRTAYVQIPQAAGLATESLSAHIGQRMRWARGMAQIFRIDNPFLGRGLNLFQRICYGNAMLHFFYGLPRLIFLIMPMAYLCFEWHLINARADMILAFVAPVVILSTFTNSMIQGRHRYTFWSEVYETVLSIYLITPTMLALINPKLGRFNVTAKGTTLAERYFDWRIALPYLLLLGIHVVGLTMGIFRLFVWNTHEIGTVLLNLTWCLFNLLVLGAAIAVATEFAQRHRHHRVNMVLPAVLYLPGGYTVNTYTQDYSVSGIGLVLPAGVSIREGVELSLGLDHGDHEVLFPAQVVRRGPQSIGLQFQSLSTEQKIALTQCTFGRADAWLAHRDQIPQDAPLRSLGQVAKHGLIGIQRLVEVVYRRLCGGQ